MMSLKYDIEIQSLMQCLEKRKSVGAWILLWKDKGRKQETDAKANNGGLLFSYRIITLKLEIPKTHAKLKADDQTQSLLESQQKQ